MQARTAAVSPWSRLAPAWRNSALGRLSSAAASVPATTSPRRRRTGWRPFATTRCSASRCSRRSKPITRPEWAGAPYASADGSPRSWNPSPPTTNGPPITGALLRRHRHRHPAIRPTTSPGYRLAGEDIPTTDAYLIITAGEAAYAANSGNDRRSLPTICRVCNTNCTHIQNKRHQWRARAHQAYVYRKEARKTIFFFY